MSEQLRESLSAAMDGEADAFELRRVLDEARQDESLREQWHRFHLVRDVLRADVKDYYPQLRDSMWQALHQTEAGDGQSPELIVPDAAEAGHAARSPWIGRLTGTAVAAVVAAVVMVNGGVFESDDEAGDFADTRFSETAPLAGALQIQPVLYEQATPRDWQRQNARMIQHIQQSAINQAGVVSFVKMATFSSAPSTQVLEPAYQTAEKVAAEKVTSPLQHQTREQNSRP